MGRMRRRWSSCCRHASTYGRWAAVSLNATLLTGRWLRQRCVRGSATLPCPWPTNVLPRGRKAVPTAGSCSKPKLSPHDLHSRGSLRPNVRLRWEPAMTADEFSYLDLVEVGDLIKARELSSVEVTQAALDRIA